MTKFTVRPRSHASVQDWIAAERGYFADEGLTDINFIQHQTDLAPVKSAGLPEQKTGAYNAAVQGPDKRDDPDQRSNVNTFCHWAVNMAVSGGHGRMWGHSYSWTVSGIYVPADSPIERPEDLASVPIAVGKLSGSHFSTVQALEKYLSPEEINLQFVGLPNLRLGLLLEGKVEAANGLGAPCFVLEQNGFRKIVDNSFIQGFLISGDVAVESAEAYFRALKRVQRDIDLDPEPFKPYVMKYSVPEEFHDYVRSVPALGIPTRIVFEEYTREMYQATRAWINGREFFSDDEKAGSIIDFDRAMLLSAAASPTGILRKP